MQSIFQSEEWEKFKLKTGYQKSYWVDDVLVLQKNLPLGYSMLYSPMAGSRIQDTEFSSQHFVDQIKKIAKENKSMFFRLELDIPKQLNSESRILNSFVKSFEHMQPENTWMLDITKDEDKLLAEMSMRCRYNIRLAAKSNIEVTSAENDKEMLENFYSLYSITGKRHGITYRSKNYFQSLLDILGKDSYARIYNATLKLDGEKKTLSSGIVVYSGKKAIYMFGASSNEHRNLKAPNLLVWKMIQDAKARGCETFDFYGIAPNDDPKHPWSGITSFKKQFGGYQVDIHGCYDQILRPIEYKLFKVLEKIRR